MSATTIVLLVLLFITLTGWIYSLSANASREQHQDPSVHGNGLPGYPTTFPPPHYSPAPREYENTSFSLWPWLIFIAFGVGIYYFMSNRITIVEPSPKTKARTVPAKGKKQKENTYVSPDSETKRQYKRDAPNYVYRDYDTSPKEEKEQRPNSYEKKEPPVLSTSPAKVAEKKKTDYTTGYGIQLFATEKYWLSAEQAEDLRRQFDGRPLLTSLLRRADGNLKRFIIGGFDTKAECKDVIRQYRKYFGEAPIIVDLSSLEEVKVYEESLPLP